MILGISILLAFGAMLFWAFGDFFIQRSTRKIGDLESLAVIGIIGSIILLPFVWQDIGLLWSMQNLVLLGVLGVFVFIMSLLNFEALKEGKLSIIDVIITIELPVTVALSIIFMKESLSVYQFMLMGMMIIGLVLTATKSFSHWKTKLERGVILAILAAILMGLVNFLTAVSSKTISPLLAIWIPWVIFTVICMVVIIRKGELKKFGKNISQFKSLLIITGVVDTLAWVFYSYATKRYDIAIITAITECYPAVAMFLGLWLNREHIRWYQYIGAILALIGSIILALTVNI